MATEPQDRRWEIQYADSDVLAHAHAHADHHRTSDDGKFIEFVDSHGRLLLSIRADLVRSIRASE